MVAVADPAKPPPPSSSGAPADDPADLEALHGYADDLVAAVEVALPAWVQRSVAARWAAWDGGELPAAVADAARDAASGAVEAVLPPLRSLLGQDVGEQRANPLSLIRRAVPYPTRVLAAAGVPPVARDEDAQRLFPDDTYDLTPASFADLDAAVHEPGLHWGAAKAHVLLRRRRGAAGPTS
jgi:hypothetical protein